MRVVTPIVFLLLAGCAFGRPEPTGWERDATTPDEAAGDQRACRHAAQARVDQDQQIDQEAAGADPMAQGGLVGTINQYDAEKRVAALTRDCMLALGYHPAGKTTP
jgi:hypothetical protein